MTIYINSKELTIDSFIEIKQLSIRNIKSVTEDDIVIFTGTVRDDLMIRNFIDNKSLPFIATFTKNRVSDFLENFTLSIAKEIETITTQLIEEIIHIKKSINDFKNYTQVVLEEQNNIEKLQLLSLYQQIQLFHFYDRDGFRDDEPSPIKTVEKEIYFDIKSNKKESVTYIILQNRHSFSVLQIDKKINEDEQKFLKNIITTKYFDALLANEEVELKNRKFSFPYSDITQLYQKDFFLFGIDNIEDFSTYSLYDSKNPKLFKSMALYLTNKKIPIINEKGLLALDSLKSLMEGYNSEVKGKELYKNLDVFLFSTSKFKSIIAQIPFDEQASFKRTILSDMFEKIYENITYSEKIKKRGVSQLRFALVLLFDNKFKELDKNIASHIFYDIGNGININSKILTNIGIDIVKEESQKKTFQNEIEERAEEKKEEMDYVEKFLKASDIKKFIQVFLGSLLNMQSHIKLNREKTLEFVAYSVYIFSTYHVKITVKNKIEKIQIAHCYLTLSSFWIEFNKNMLFLYFDDFLNLEEENIEIEYFFNDREPYSCKEEKDKIILNIQDSNFSLLKDTLRQRNSRFLNRLLTVGQFYKYFSQTQRVEDIISLSLQKIKDDRVDIKSLCKNKISTQFLSIFFRSKKECDTHLKAFLEESRKLLI